MKQEQLDHYRRKLLDVRGTLGQVEETGSQAEQTVELDQTRMGRLSRMDALQAQAMSKETGRRRRVLLREIEKALERIEENEFGFCEECGQDIAAARLEIEPTARHCITCAEQLEQ